MQLHRPSQQERLQHVAFQLVHRDDDDQDDQRGDGTVRDECDENGHAACHYRTEDRDERRDEHQCRRHVADGRQAARERRERGATRARIASTKPRFSSVS